MTVVEIPSEVLAAIRRRRMIGCTGAQLRYMYASVLADADEIDPAEKQHAMRVVLAALNLTRPAAEPVEWEAS